MYCKEEGGEILLWCGLVVVSSLYVTIPMLPIFATQFKVSTSYAAWTGSAFSFAYAIGFLFFGPLSEKHGRKQMMISGLIALSIVTVILGTAKSLTTVTLFKQMSMVFFQRFLFFCYLTTVTLLLSFVGMYTTLGNYLNHPPFDLSNNQILVIRAAGIFGMVLSPFAGRIAELRVRRILS